MVQVLYGNMNGEEFLYTVSEQFSINPRADANSWRTSSRGEERRFAIVLSSGYDSAAMRFYTIGKETSLRGAVTTSAQLWAAGNPGLGITRDISMDKRGKDSPPADPEGVILEVLERRDKGFSHKQHFEHRKTPFSDDPIVFQMIPLFFR